MAISALLFWSLLISAFHPLWLWWGMLAAQCIGFYRESNALVSLREYAVGMSVFHILNYYWLMYPLQDKMHLGFELSALMVAGVALIHSALWLLLIRVRRSMSLTASYPVFTWGLLWLMFEYLKAIFLGGFPWCSLALTQMDGPLAPLVSVLGQTGLSFVVAISGAVLYQSMRLALLLGGVLLMAGALVHMQSPVAVGAIKTMAYQTNSTDTHKKPVYERIELLSAPIPDDTDLVVFPEGMFSVFEEDLSYIEKTQAIASQSAQHNPHIIYGLNIKKPNGDMENAVRVLDKNGLIMQYNKHYLVPFAEKFPPGFASFREWVPGAPKYIAGEGHAIARIQEALINIKICYDIFFPDFFPERRFNASVIVIDDEWYRQAPVREIHLRQTRLYALMTQKSVLSATTNGLTALVNAQGHTVRVLTKDVAGYLSINLPLYEGLTWAQRIPWDWLFKVALILMFTHVMLQKTMRRFWQRKER